MITELGEPAIVMLIAMLLERLYQAIIPHINTTSVFILVYTNLHLNLARLHRYQALNLVPEQVSN